jgi:hypothetical protein
MPGNPNRASKRRRRTGPPAMGVNVQNHVNAIVKANGIISPEPPMFGVSHHYVQRFRFVISFDVVAYPINPSDFANLLLVALEDSSPGTAVSAAPIYTRFLLKSVEIWALPTSLTAPVTVTLTPQNSGTTSANSEVTLSDTPKSIDRYAYVRYRPKLTSPIGQYQNQTTSGGAIRISAPATSICDVVMHAWVCNGETPALVSVFVPTVAVGQQPSVSTGQVFLSALDPSSTGQSIFIPQGYANVISDLVDPTPRP